MVHRPGIEPGPPAWQALKRWINPNGPKFRHIHAGSIATKLGEGRSNDAVASFVWGHRFCVITQEEWCRSPLTPAQDRHIAYEMNLVDALFSKVGPDVLKEYVVNA